MTLKTKKSKDYYSLLVSKKAQLPNIIHKLKSDFNFKTQQLKEIFSLPHLIALESYVKAFQYEVINSILYTNGKLCKIGFRINSACIFCNDEPENLYQFFYQCPHSKTFWTDFESYWCHLSNQPIHLSAENVLFGILSKQCPLSNLFNYFTVIENYFCGTAEEAKHFLKSKDCNQNLRLNIKRKKISTIKPSLKRNGCSLQCNYLCPSCFIAFFNLNRNVCFLLLLIS